MRSGPGRSYFWAVAVLRYCKWRIGIIIRLYYATAGRFTATTKDLST